MKRTLLLLSGLIFGLFAAAQGQFINPLHIPDTLHGPTYNLTMGTSKAAFLPGDSTDTYGISADILGPTLIMRKGDQVQMNVTNLLPDTSTMHWHGMHVAPEDDGGPHSKIAPGATWSPDFTVLDEATTFWYHPHLHHFTALHVYKGCAGMIIVEDDHSDSLNLPSTYGVDDFPIIIQDKTFDTTNQFIFAAMNDTVMVNRTLGPYLEVPAQMVRLRLLNGSNQRIYNLGFPPLMYVRQIGSDGGLLEAPIISNRFQISPGERMELVVDFSTAPMTTFPFTAFNSEMGPGLSGGPNGPGGGPNNPLDGVDFQLMEFRVVSQTPNPVTSIPANLNSFTRPLEVDADVIRTKVFTVDSSGFPFYINGQIFNMSRVDDTIQLDDIEIWELINPSDVAHPFHIHDIQFFVLDVNGNPPIPPLRGKKDVINMNPGDTIRFITQFTDFADETIPYMFHCHNLFHEDGGMMGQFIVVNPTNRWEELNRTLGVKAYPNPNHGRINLEAESGAMERVEVVNLMGGLLRTIEVGALQETALDLSGLPNGMYLLRISLTNGKSGVLKVLKE